MPVLDKILLFLCRQHSQKSTVQIVVQLKLIILGLNFLEMRFNTALLLKTMCRSRKIIASCAPSIGFSASAGSFKLKKSP